MIRILFCLLFIITTITSNGLAARVDIEDSMNADPTEYGVGNAFQAIDGMTEELYSFKSEIEDKTDGVPGIQYLYTADGTATFGTGWVGPDTATDNTVYKYPSTKPTAGQQMSFSAPVTTEIGGNSYEVVTVSWVSPSPGGSLSITEQSSDPTFSEMSEGDLIVSTSSGDMFYKSSTGGYSLTGTYTIDSIIPTIGVGGVVAVGNEIAITFNTAVTQGSGYTDNDLNIDGATMGNDVALTYSSGDGTTVHNYISATAAIEDEVVNFDFLGRTDGLESSTGDDLAAITSLAVVNNTTDAVACTGTFPTATENFEAVADGDFCTTGLTETDTPAILTTNSAEQAVTGTKSMKISGTGSAYSTYNNGTADFDWFKSFAFRTPSSTPTADLYVFQFAGSGFNGGVALQLAYTTDGYISAVSATTATVSTALSAGTWYWVDVDYNGTGTCTLDIYNDNSGVKGTQVGSQQTFTGYDVGQYFFHGMVSNAVTSEFFIDAITLTIGGL